MGRGVPNRIFHNARICRIELEARAGPRGGDTGPLISHIRLQLCACPVHREELTYTKAGDTAVVADSVRLRLRTAAAFLLELGHGPSKLSWAYGQTGVLDQSCPQPSHHGQVSLALSISI